MRKMQTFQKKQIPCKEAVWNLVKRYIKICNLLDGQPMSWNSKKQSIVALSCTEAEYIFAAETKKGKKRLKITV